MSGPWEKYQTQDDGPWAKYQAQAEPAMTSAAPDLPKGFTIGGLPLVSDAGVWADIKRSFGLAGRSGINAVSALPLAAANFGVASRNLLGNATNAVMGNPATPDYELPSSTWQRSLNDAGLPHPTGKLEKTVDFINQVALGSKLPVPSAGDKAAGVAGESLSDIAKNYRPIAPVRDATLKASQAAGYVVPPSTTNPTLGNKIMESVGGKIATAQDAAAKNAEITNDLAKRTLGLHPDAPLTEGALQALRSDASPAYEAIKGAGAMQSDATYEKALDGLVSKYQGASKSFPGLVNDQVSKLVESLKQPTFEADSAVDATKVLRESASKAYSQGDKALGSAYKNASNALESLMERNLAGRVEKASLPTTADAINAQLAALSKRAQSLPEDLPLDDPKMQAIEKSYNALKEQLTKVGGEIKLEPGVSLAEQQKNSAKAAELLSNFRNSRQLIAKTYSVGNALNPATGNVSAVKLAQQLSKGKPLSNELRTAAEFGQAFPKAAAAITDSGSVRNTDVILGAGTSAMSHDPKYLPYPFLRMAMRKGLLSKAGQMRAVPASSVADMSPAAMGSSQAIAHALLGQ